MNLKFCFKTNFSLIFCFKLDFLFFSIDFISNSLWFLKVLYFAPVNEMALSITLSAVNVLFSEYNY